MKAHLFDDGGGMVTGTTDIKAARRLLVEKRLEDQGVTLISATREEIARASREFPAQGAAREVGRIIPDQWDLRWKTGYALGKPGVTTAVVWS